MSIFGKIRDVLGVNESYEYDDEYFEGDDEPEAAPATAARTSRRSTRLSATTETGVASNVIGLPGLSGSASDMIIKKPRSFDEMPQVVQALRDRKSVVLNLTLMDPDQAQRAVDFVAGATFAIDGHQERIDESIFLFAPNCVNVQYQEDGQLQTEPASPLRSGLTTPAPSWASQSVPFAVGQ